MTPADFNRLAPRTRLKHTALAQARAVLVDGLPAAEVARRTGAVQSVVARAAARIRAELRRESQTCPTCDRPFNG